jgi:F-type H+-transporting ATPase subunit beta
MQKYDSLKNIIAIVGENELSPADRADYQNAKKLINFFNQDFSVAEKFSGRPGEYFSLDQTLDGVEKILNEIPEIKPPEAKEEPSSENKKDEDSNKNSVQEPADKK